MEEKLEKETEEDCPEGPVGRNLGRGAREDISWGAPAGKGLILE